MYGDDIYTKGFHVYTTIDSHLQNTANEAVRNGLLSYDQRHGYRGPERNLGSPNLNHMEEWETTLNSIPTFNNLEPAVVVDMAAHSVTALRANGSLIVIPWQGLSWARAQINANYLGKKPGTARDILKLGDLIRKGTIAEGMISFDGSLLTLVRDGLIDEETALYYATSPTDLKLKLDGFA